MLAKAVVAFALRTPSYVVYPESVGPGTTAATSSQPLPGSRSTSTWNSSGPSSLCTDVLTAKRLSSVHARSCTSVPVKASSPSFARPRPPFDARDLPAGLAAAAIPGPRRVITCEEVFEFV